MTTTWHRVAPTDDIDEEEPISVTIGEKVVGVFKVDGEIYAIEDVCPHAFALLSQGFIDGDEVECPLHGAVFHIPTGKCLKAPAERDLERYEVKTEDGHVFVEVKS